MPFVSVENMKRLIHHVGLETMLCELADLIEADFRRWERFDKTPRMASHSRAGVIELMPTSDGLAYSFKYVNGHPINALGGLQTVAAFGLLAEVSTGYPVLLTEMTLLTALRTAATSAMAARHLAPKGARTMSLIGNGAQAEFQALAMKAVVGIDSIRLYDIDRRATDKALRNLKGSSLNLVACASAENAIEGAQIITTATADKQFATILTDNMVGPGVHINAIGGDCPGKTELAPPTLLRADTFVEYPPRTWIEGEIQQMDRSYPITELWRVVVGPGVGSPGRASRSRCSIAWGSPGRFSALHYVRERMAETGFYETLDMIADPDDSVTPHPCSSARGSLTAASAVLRPACFASISTAWNSASQEMNWS